MSIEVTRDAPALGNIGRSKSEIGGNHPLDEAVIQALPSDLKILSADCYRTSAWSATASIRAESSDGGAVRFFIKYATGEHGKRQLEGEYRSMNEIHQTIPNLAPKPRGFGELQSSPQHTYFFVCDFVNISDKLPDPRHLGERLAQLHRQSQSPTGEFGFYCPTYDGKLPQRTEWDESWASFFSKLLAGIAELDTGVNGPWAELAAALDVTVKVVIPRLLGVLEQNGRSIKPCLIHGDLWEGNIGTDLETGEIYIFDAASYYGHNEMELGIWRTDHHRMSGPSYKREYERHFQASEPAAEWDDRNRLYCVKTQLMYSAHVPGTHVRNAALDNLKYLIAKYGEVPEASQAEPLSQPPQGDAKGVMRDEDVQSLNSPRNEGHTAAQPVVITIEV